MEDKSNKAELGSQIKLECGLKNLKASGSLCKADVFNAKQ